MIIPRSISSLGCAFWIAGIPAILPAQEPPIQFSIQEAVALAREHSPELRRAESAIDVARAGVLRGWGAYLPSLSAAGAVSEFSSHTMTARNEFGQPVTLDDPASFSATSAWGTVSASFVLFDGFRRWNELQAARADSRVAHASRSAEAVRVEAEVQRRFYRALGAERLLEAEERLLEAAQGRLDATRQMVVAGRATHQDVIGAEVDLARQQIALASARADRHSAGLLLWEVIGTDPEGAWELAGDLPSPTAFPPPDAEALVAAALHSSPEIRRAEAAAVEAGHLVGTARAARLPTIRAGAGMSREISLPGAGELASFPWNRGITFGISVSLPLFDGFATTERIARAKAERVNAQEQLRKARLSVERLTRTAVAEIERASETVRLAERVAELTRTRLESGQEGFRHGLVGFTELQQLIDQAAQAQRRVVSARIEYGQAWFTLEEAIGGKRLSSDVHREL